MLEDVTEASFFNYLVEIKFFGEMKFTVLPVTKTNGIDWFKKFNNITVKNNDLYYGDRTVERYQAYEIDKALLMQIRQKSSFCSAVASKVTCKIPFFLKLAKNQRSYLRDGHFKKIISIKLTRYEDRIMQPFNYFKKDIPVKTIMVQRL